MHVLIGFNLIFVNFSPNTVGLRDLQGKTELEHLLKAVSSVTNANKVEGKRRTPVLLKIAPDLNYQQLADIAQVLLISEVCTIVFYYLIRPSLVLD